MKIKKIFIAIIFIILALNLSGCTEYEHIMKEKFAPYTADNSVGVVYHDHMFYFADHVLDLKDVARADGDNYNDGYLFMDGKLYFSTYKKNRETNRFSLSIYTCDLYGNNKQLIFEKHGYKTNPYAVGNDGIFYVRHYEKSHLFPSSCIIDAYDIKNGTYKTVETGADAELNNYRPDTAKGFFCDFSNDTFTLNDTLKNAQYTIDDELLRNSHFGEALTDLDYGFDYKIYELNGRIYLLYRIYLNDPFSFGDYPYFICEYLPSENKIVFSAFVCPFDCEGLELFAYDSAN